MPKLGVNVDHVATLRQARGGIEPDPVWAASVCEQAGDEAGAFPCTDLQNNMAYDSKKGNTNQESAFGARVAPVHWVYCVH